MRVFLPVIFLTAAYAQYVPEPYGWACYRMASKRSWPQCASLSGAKQRACLCTIPEFVELTESCLTSAVANASDPEEAIRIAHESSSCPVQTSPLTSIKKPITAAELETMPEHDIINPISPEEIEIAISTADWRMTNDRRAERAGATLVAFWGFVIFVRYVAHLLGKFLFYPWFTRLLLWRPVRLVRVYIMNAPLGRRQHNEPWLKKLGIRFPTRSITIVLIIFAALNYALIFSDFPYTEWNFIYPTKSQQWNKTLAIRCAFVIMWKSPLVFCFSGRNNIFLLLGHPWPLDTFNTFHRWIARMTIVDIIIHGIAISLVKAEQNSYGYVWSVEYWIWGIVGVIVSVIISIQSMHWISRAQYEVFKAIHLTMAIIFVIATWYHVRVLPYGLKHTYAIIAIWTFDYSCRVIRVLSAHKVEAHLQHYTKDVMSVTMRTPKSFSLSMKSQSAFIYLHLPPYYYFWQSHPFTMMKPLSADVSGYTEKLPSDKNTTPSISPKKGRYANISSFIEANSDGFTFLDLQNLNTEHPSIDSMHLTSKNYKRDDKDLMIGIKARNGLTRKLAKMDDGPISIALDGPYGTFFPLQRFRNLVCIAGGIGITAHLSYIQFSLENHNGYTMNIRLHWAIKHVQDYAWMFDFLNRLAPNIQLIIHVSENQGDDALEPTELDPRIFTYDRLNTMEVVQNAVKCINESGDAPAKNPMAIFACGPERLNDDSRLAACWAIKHANVFVDYFEDSFNW